MRKLDMLCMFKLQCSTKRQDKFDNLLVDLLIFGIFRKLR